VFLAGEVAGGDHKLEKDRFGAGVGAETPAASAVSRAWRWSPLQLGFRRRDDASWVVRGSGSSSAV
jgi:hypothetical protein